jgi:hypothetical protein
MYANDSATNLPLVLSFEVEALLIELDLLMNLLKTAPTPS